ncbi:MAG: SGNH/GDSL hydrolase family protein [Planctomycetia bacterium]|nr:SGNH/GDSL hydrolase family protein [Planctomycetia bacterium]
MNPFNIAKKMIVSLTLCLFFLMFSSTLVAQEPTWDMKKAQLAPELTVGEVTQSADGTIHLNGTNAFAIPAEAFPDMENFTVVLTAKFGSAPRRTSTSFSLMRKHAIGDETGFEYYVTQLPWDHVQLGSTLVVNGMYAEGRGIREPGDAPCTFILAVRKGCPSCYFNDYLGRRCFVQTLPNSEPMWVGWCSEEQLKKDRVFQDVTILDLKVFGADYDYVCPHEPKEEEPRGAILGKGWVIDAPTVTDEARPHILIYGDSISIGYRGALISRLKGRIYVDHFCGFVGNTCDTVAYTAAAGNRQYDMIFFNNGLHSLHWTPDKVSDEEIYNRTCDIVRSFRAGSPEAKLYWLATTPHTAARPAPGQPVEALGERNPMVMRINRIAEQVMKDENVEILDTYTPLVEQLDLASGDGYHWNGAAYKIIADMVAEKAEECLK